VVRENQPIIRLLCRDGKKRRMINVVGFRPYLYVPLDSPIPNRPEITSTEEVETLSVDGERLKKIYVRVPKDVRSVRTAFEKSLEADVLFGDRFKIDKGIKEGIEIQELKNEYNPSEIRGY
jgi:DNA polymerase I